MAMLSIINPELPFLEQIRGGMKPGLMLTIKGKIESGRDKKIDIDFINSPPKPNQDIIMRLSIRPDLQAIVRNSSIGGKWDDEKRDGPFVKADETFEIIIFAKQECFSISVNDYDDIILFHHRAPMNLIQYVYITHKDAIVEHVLLEEAARCAGHSSSCKCQGDTCSLSL